MAKSCPHITTCALFPRFKLQDSLAIWKINYCEGTYERCERHQRAERGEDVPPMLLPNGRELKLPSF